MAMGLTRRKFPTNTTCSKPISNPLKKLEFFLDLFDFLVEGAHARDGADVVGDGDEGGPGEVLLADATALVLGVHVAKTAGHKVTGQVEALVVASVNVPDEFVDARAVAARRQLDGLLERTAPRQQAAQPQERAAPQAGARDALVHPWTVHRQDAHPRSNVYQLKNNSFQLK
jgi:hypothetical protein